MKNPYINDPKMMTMRADRDREQGYSHDDNVAEDALYGFAISVFSDSLLSDAEKVLMLTTLRHYVDRNAGTRTFGSFVTSMVQALTQDWKEDQP